MITRFGVAPFICTLGMMYVARGSALLFNDGSTYPNLNGMEALGNTGFATLGSGTLLRRLSADLADDRLPRAGLLADH
ncbi:sugar ABC transporter permease [Klebsiella pneumoniae]|uniref:Sugar ABC transporter permease n=1 Tax=Klebsiella pneumoniae TaxID=573 RepID=A0A378FAE7_KLEPN|nr:sugar ABC transporter permease [Klebsiella pneumoniae]